MVLAERCVLLSAEILKSQSKYSEAAALLIRLTSEVLKMCSIYFSNVSLISKTIFFKAYAKHESRRQFLFRNLQYGYLFVELILNVF